jgi:hypothetical protein
VAKVKRMCTRCELGQVETTDFFDSFEYDEKSLDHYDGPLAGWMKCRSCGQWFAFDCLTIIDTMLWHWSLVPAEKSGDSREAIVAAANNRDGWWLSVVEDRRGSGQKHLAVRIQNRTARPVAAIAMKQ